MVDVLMCTWRDEVRCISANSELRSSQLLSQLPESSNNSAALTPVGICHMFTLIKVFYSPSFSQNNNLKATYCPLRLDQRFSDDRVTYIFFLLFGRLMAIFVGV